MAIVYVKPGFKQRVVDGELQDTVVFSSSFGVEVETDDPDYYAPYLLDQSQPLEQIFYELKLDYCLQMRADEYAKLNQQEMQYDDAVNGTTTWIDAIQAIKDKYPKPTPPDTTSV